MKRKYIAPAINVTSLFMEGNLMLSSGDAFTDHGGLTSNNQFQESIGGCEDGDYTDDFGSLAKDYDSWGFDEWDEES